MGILAFRAGWGLPVAFTVFTGVLGRMGAREANWVENPRVFQKKNPPSQWFSILSLLSNKWHPFCSDPWNTSSNLFSRMSQVRY